MERKALKLALEKIERFITKQGYFDDFADEITAIKEALAQPAREPVDWEQIYWDMVNAMLRDKLRAQPAQELVGEVTENTDNGFKCEFNQRLTAGTQLYTTPPKRPWVGLTNEDKHEIELHAGITEDDDGYIVSQVFKLTETKLKDKNNGT